MPLVAMQHDGIRLQQAGKKIGRDCHPARAMMTARTSSNGNRRDAEASQKTISISEKLIRRARRQTSLEFSDC